MEGLDQFEDAICTQDTKTRLTVHVQLVSHLQDHANSIASQDLSRIIEGLALWVKCSNYKISSNGLEVLGLLIDRLGEKFANYIGIVVGPVVDRLGDSKDQVRDAALQVLLKLMPCSCPQDIFDRANGAFTHKLWRIRESILICLQQTLNHYGARCLTLNKIVPLICNMLEDQSTQVRDQAVLALVEIYRHVGEKVRSDLSKRGLVSNKLRIIEQKMDEMKQSGNMLATADMRSVDEPDFLKPVATAPKLKKQNSTTLDRKAGPSGSRQNFSSGNSGAIDEVAFEQGFVSVPKVTLSGGRELTEHIQKIIEVLSKSSQEWEKRVSSLKSIRSVIIAGGIEYAEFPQLLRNLESALVTSVKDLRSQVVREACITLAFLSRQLGSKFDHCAEIVLPAIIILIPNSAKIMSTSGCTCLRYIIASTHSHRLIPLLTPHLTAKSSSIRRECFLLLTQMLQTWPTHVLERHVDNIQSSITRGISDADAEARSHSRKAFWEFAEHFKPQADALLSSLDPAKQRQLQGSLSRSSSNTSLNSINSSTSSKRSHVRSVSTDRASQPMGRRGSASSQAAASRRLMQCKMVTNPPPVDPKTRPKKITAPVSRDRNKSKMGMSLSQPGSRSTSPTSRLNYLINQSPSAASKPRRLSSGIPRSQGTSRESSPSRLTYGRERRYSGAGVRRSPKKPVQQRFLQPGNESEMLLNNALRHLPSRRDNAFESDDAGSETSSLCSDRSYSSFSRMSEDVSEIVTNLTSGSWADRKEGLMALQHVLATERQLTRSELKNLTDVLTKMFHDPHGKVFSMFLETLLEFVACYKVELVDWMSVCLTRLLNKLGVDMLGSVQAKVQRALDSIRNAFPYQPQFNFLSRFIIDQTQSPNLKVKVALLNYMHSLIMVMDPADFCNTGDVKLAISRIITWTTEPKSVEVRKAAQAVLISLFNLNTSEFSMLLSGLPKTFQDSAHKILQSHVKQASHDAEPLSPRNYAPSRVKTTPPQRSRIEEYETENMNPEDIYNSFRQTSADIQNLSKLGDGCALQKDRYCNSQDSGIQSAAQDSRPQTPPRKYNPAPYADQLANEMEQLKLGDNSEDQTELIQEILTELSNHNERQNERLHAMQQLTKLTQNGSAQMWSEHFKAILLILLETLGDNSYRIRANSLKVLREILNFQPQRFQGYAELTIMKVLEAHRDAARDVTRAAEDCAATLAASLSSVQCVRVLNPIIQTTEYPINLAALKMLTRVIEHSSATELASMMEEMMPGLLSSYDDSESCVRKASVFSLVAIYMKIGEDLRPHLSHLNCSKMKLLNLYIKRASTQASSASSSHTTSPSSVVMDQV